MCPFVVLDLVFFRTKPRTGLGKRLQNDLFCVEWDVKPQLNQSTRHSYPCRQTHREGGLTEPVEVTEPVSPVLGSLQPAARLSARQLDAVEIQHHAIRSQHAITSDAVRPQELMPNTHISVGQSVNQFVDTVKLSPNRYRLSVPA